MFRTKIVHTSGHIFVFLGVVIFRFWGSENIFNLCSHIELNTQNPNPIFKITISFTKTPQMPKYFRKIGKHSNKSKNQKNKNKEKSISFGIIYKLHNSIVEMFGIFVILGFLDFLDFYLYTRIRVGLFVSWCRDVVPI